MLELAQGSDKQRQESLAAETRGASAELLKTILAKDWIVLTRGDRCVSLQLGL